jgi:hypothetical protein
MKPGIFSFGLWLTRFRSVLTFDKSPDYMRSAQKMGQIVNLLPSAKILLILRNPSSRAYSGDTSLPHSNSPPIGFHHNCRHSRFARFTQPYLHKGTQFSVGAVIRTDEEYNRNEDKSSVDGSFDDSNNFLVLPSHLSSIISLLQRMSHLLSSHRLGKENVPLRIFIGR